MERVKLWTRPTDHATNAKVSDEVISNCHLRAVVRAERTFVAIAQSMFLLLMFVAVGCKSTHPIDTVTAEDVRELEEYRELHPEVAEKANERSMLTSLKRSASQRNQPIRRFSDRPC